MVDVDKHVGRQIREIRKQLNLSQQDLAAELGWQQTKLSRIERGATPITASELVQISMILGRAPSHLLPRGDTLNLSPLEEQMLELFRQLDGNIRRAAALKGLIELRDEEEYFAENMLHWNPARSSSKFEQLLRWVGVGGRPDRAVDPAYEMEPPRAKQIPPGDQEPFYAPYANEMEMRELRQLVLRIQHDLKNAYDNDEWESLDFEAYQREIASIKQQDRD